MHEQLTFSSKLMPVVERSHETVKTMKLQKKETRR